MYGSAADRECNPCATRLRRSGCGVCRRGLPASGGRVALSPRIAFQSSQSGDYEIWSMGLDGSGLRNLTHTKGYDSDPAWSPNGKRIAFTSYRTGWPKIWVMNADGSGLRQLTRGYSKEGGAVWTPDSPHVVYGSMPDPPVAGAAGWWIMRPDGTLVFGTNRSPTGLAVINRDGTGLAPVGVGRVMRAATPVWQPGR
jgi:dipeptidyl aminopeptidase/acylaminoacyl peptidase